MTPETCPDCHGSGQYIPLIGPPEPCLACSDQPRVKADDILQRIEDRFNASYDPWWVTVTLKTGQRFEVVSVFRPLVGDCVVRLYLDNAYREIPVADIATLEIIEE